MNPQVKRLTATVAKNCSKFYCGLAADWLAVVVSPANRARTSQFRGTRRRHGPECAFDLVEHAQLAIEDWHSSNPSGTRVAEGRAGCKVHALPGGNAGDQAKRAANASRVLVIPMPFLAG
jgi:hypothetical protein